MRQLLHRACFLFPTLLLAAPLCLGLSATSPSPGKTPAAALAEHIDSRYNALRSLSVHFSQSYDGMGMHRVESGTLLLTHSGRFHEGHMRWTYDNPPGKLFVFDGHFAYFYTPGQSEVQRVPASQLDDLRSPLALLLGHAKLGSQLENTAVRPEANGSSTLTGVPRGLEQRVQQLSITASPDGLIEKLVIEDVDGSRNSFTFSNDIPNAPVPASAFLFTAPPGTHIVDGIAPM